MTRPNDESVRSDGGDQADDELDELRGVLLEPQAMVEPVQKSLLVAINQNREAVAEVIFPIIGPAIRRAIHQALQQMIDNADRLLNNSLSLRRIRWRIEAARTGRSFAEVALTHSLIYEVEQVFLIHRETGLLLHHVSADRIVAQAPEVVSGMLTGIRAFVTDSFGGDDNDGVRRLEVGERTVWVEQKGRAVIAAVVRGTGPTELGWALQNTLEKIVAAHSHDLRTFTGNTAVFDTTKPYLQACLQSAQRTEQRKPWAAYALVAALILCFVVVAARHWQWRVDAARAVAVLQTEPGYRILQHRTGWNQLHLAGAMDPLARSLDAVLADTAIEPSAVVAVWVASEDPRLALPRAVALLEPPKEVTFHLRHATLVITGTASASWCQGLSRLARTISGIQKVDLHRLQVRKERTLSSALEQLQTLRIRFNTEEAIPDASEIDRLKSALLAVDAAVVAPLRIRVEGRADPSGSPTFNQRISRLRAETVAQALSELPLQYVQLSAHGMGASFDSPKDGLDPEKRSVMLRVER
ncbi:MAG: hypothetical protein AAF449_22425 [Myxococcota bacterium]